MLCHINIHLYFSLHINNTSLYKFINAGCVFFWFFFGWSCATSSLYLEERVTESLNDTVQRPSRLVFQGFSMVSMIVGPFQLFNVGSNTFKKPLKMVPLKWYKKKKFWKEKACKSWKCWGSPSKKIKNNALQVCLWVAVIVKITKCPVIATTRVVRFLGR